MIADGLPATAVAGRTGGLRHFVDMSTRYKCRITTVRRQARRFRHRCGPELGRSAALRSSAMKRRRATICRQRRELRMTAAMLREGVRL